MLISYLYCPYPGRQGRRTRRRLRGVQPDPFRSEGRRYHFQQTDYHCRGCFHAHLILSCDHGIKAGVGREDDPDGNGTTTEHTTGSRSTIRAGTGRSFSACEPVCSGRTCCALQIDTARTAGAMSPDCPLTFSSPRFLHRDARMLQCRFAHFTFCRAAMAAVYCNNYLTIMIPT
jgi:hypothetical protein